MSQRIANRLLAGIVIAQFALTCVVVLSGSQKAPPNANVIEVKELILRDSTGGIRAKLYIRKDEGEEYPMLVMFDKDGNQNTALGAFGKGSLLLVRGHGKDARQIELGVSGTRSHIIFADQNNKDRIKLLHSEENVDGLFFEDEESLRAGIGAFKGIGRVELFVAPKKVLRLPPEE